MRRFQNRRQAPPGLSRLGTLIWLLLLAGGVYLGVKFVPPYWDYLSMLEPVKEAAMAAAIPVRKRFGGAYCQGKRGRTGSGG